MKKLDEPLTETVHKTSREITKTLTEPSFMINEALDKLNHELQEKMNDRGIIASYL